MFSTEIVWPRSAVIAALFLYMAVFAPKAAVAAQQEQPKDRRVTVFYTGSVQGTLEPCGCNSDPLGGLDRFAGLVRSAARKGPVLLVDAGNLLYPAAGVPANKRDAGRLRAAFVVKQMEALGLAGSPVGEGDLALGASGLGRFRLSANLKLDGAAPSRIVTVGKIRVGLFGIADPDAAQMAGLPAENPVSVALSTTESLRKQGAEVVIALVALDRSGARRIAARANIDFVIYGKHTGEGLEKAVRVGGSTLLAAGEELQRAGRLDLVIRAAGPIVDAGSPEETIHRREQLTEKIRALKAQLERWKRGEKGTDPSFVASKTAELSGAESELHTLGGTAWQAPATGSYFVNRLIRIQRVLPQDKSITSQMRSLDKAIGKVNLAQAVAPPAPTPGRATFVGQKACASCHKEATAFWKKTVHAGAWRTLVDGGKDLDLECVSCHVTGYGEVGGSALGFTRNLEAIQCETCHGPGSVHVAEKGLEDPPAVRLETPETTCLGCHNEKHSDTFAYDPYLRDILGPGHGKARRARLGQGPTGGELRRAAMARARNTGKQTLQQAARDL
jgi:Cytochrome c554 and c-prime